MRSTIHPATSFNATSAKKYVDTAAPVVPMPSRTAASGAWEEARTATPRERIPRARWRPPGARSRCAASGRDGRDHGDGFADRLRPAAGERDELPYDRGRGVRAGE